MNEFLDAAKAYLKAGLHPIPCEPRGKKPLVQWKIYQDEAPTEALLNLWWTTWPDANVALPMGRGLFVLDVDGPEGVTALEEAGLRLETIDEVGRVETGKGLHYYLRGDVADRIGVLPKVDVRSAGGYVVAPPSLHVSGRRYTWTNGFPSAFPAAPAKLVELLARPTRPTQDRTQAESWVSTALAGAGEGSRNQTCARLAGYFLGKGVEQDVVEEIMRGWAARCSPPYEGDRGNTVEEIVARIAAREGAPAAPPSGIAEVLDVAMAEISAPKDQRKPAASTSLESLDALLAGGLYPGEYVILGARPSVGKTALALQIGRLLAKQRTGVLFVSCEMTRTALVRRMLSQESGVRAKALKTGELIDLERQMLKAGAERLRVLPIWITSDVHTTDQLAETLTAYSPGTLGLVVVDYLQLMSTAENIRDPRQRVEAVSKALRRMTIQHEVPLIALSSLSRPPKNVKEWEPSLSDLRESGELEHDADIVWLMHRLLDQQMTKLKVAKNRDGEVSTADIPLLFNGTVLTFEEA